MSSKYTRSEFYALVKCEIFWGEGGTVMQNLTNVTLLITVSIEVTESWEMVCLRTPRGRGARGVEVEGDSIIMSSCCDPSVLCTMWLSGKNTDPSTKREMRKLSLEMGVTELYKWPGCI